MELLLQRVVPSGVLFAHSHISKANAAASEAPPSRLRQRQYFISIHNNYY